MAEQPLRHAPEITQFYLKSDENSVEEPGVNTAVDKLLTSAVMHLALIRRPGNKLADEADTREYDYMIHPIYSAFFVFSYRWKRKTLLSPKELIGLVTNPKSTIREILSRLKLQEDKIPEQLQLFEAYYSGGS
jgi:hypothetical protein